MDNILDKYVSPCVLMTLGFSSSQLAARGRWAGKTFRRALAWRKLVFRLVELVNQSKEKGCEDLVSSAMMCIGELAGCVVLPRFSLLTGKYPEGLC